MRPRAQSPPPAGASLAGGASASAAPRSSCAVGSDRWRLGNPDPGGPVSYTHLRAHETLMNL
eukprot:1143063-Prorocentrum_minimum.AAC.1